ncbi:MULTISPECIES: 50S ribosomal protein L24 [unclassified Sedimentibacter]|uniref:50S ribosomal protein L24 n=1 Tax=unclassified Sedimentibacter TaxID=2649220 RepID=UPI0027DF8014|nr:50S ribosomal protein L24 [Sedimentibacter sp. MB35-C1]WMJ76611.1 50S ribosomal protein L24 [Sedimentibacter sp. MB35-C1]
MHVKKGDKVVVISGSDKGKIGKVLTSLPKQNRVIVEGVRMVTKHQKATNQMQQAGILHQEGAINASNVMIYCEKCKSGVRTEVKIENGKKVRACKKCGSVL